ncbi:hypothetical protein B0H14DRAFT_3493309 [Mycena olivaceomarginata]|nr:hypothetical protein B0H14DRAFT_3493309 [Mycena olivaceomarginata]
MSGILEQGKEFLSKDSGSNNNNTTSTQGNQGTRTTPTRVGLDAFEKKEGIPENRGMNEKITDGARNEFENTTGDNVSSKISN